MLNYVNRVLFGKATGAANTGTNLTNTVKGDLLVLDKSTLAVLDATTAAACKEAIIAQGTGAVTATGKVILSAPIVKSSIIKYTKQSYAAAVAHVLTYADLNLEAGKEYKIIIVFRDELRLISNRQTRIVIHHKTPAAASFVEATEVAKIVAKINADKVASTLLTAASDGVDGITLTGKAIPTESINDYEFVSFTSSFVTISADLNSQLDTSIVPTVTAQATSGSGLPAQLKQVERYALGYLGITDLRDFRTNKSVPSFVSDEVTGGGYDIYHILHFDNHTGDLQQSMKSPVQTTICVATGSAQGTAIEAILNDFVSGVDGGAAIGTNYPASPAGE